MLQQILSRLTEAAQYIEHVGGRLTKDQKLAASASFEELNTEHYKNALHHLELALDYLAKQRELIQQYQKDEEERTAEEPSNRLSSRMDQRF